MIRILDLGAHDGFVTLWLARQLRERGVEVRVDGVELHPGAVEIARRRLSAEGVAGSIIQGDALHPSEYFEPGTYDVVVAYELIEHVPDPAALLAAAEGMLAPGGRVYVSTPDGTFGAGSNPHHLRAYRAQDLADLLRRRGRLHDMTVGTDGITVASYSPAERRGDIAIYTGAAWSPWSPVDIERKGLGGSETAAVRLAEQLSELGYVVTVYGEVEQSCYRDVIFRHHSAFDPTVRRECVISSRIPELFDQLINARVRMLWMHDTDCQDRLTPGREERIDHILVLSRWHEEHVGGMYPFARPKLRRIRNGIEHAYFTGPLEEPRAQRMIYTSSPDRGLDILLEMWPKIRKQAPEAVFAFCYADVYDAVADQQPDLAAYRDRVKSLADQPGIQVLGSLPQPEVARLMRTSMVWAHPSWASPQEQPFYETYCIGAVEAQAAGCMVVASDWGALSEVVTAGHLINSGALSDRWREAFVNSVVEGLTNPETQAWAQEKGPTETADLGWGGVARSVAGLIDGEAFAFAG